ncbi:MAG: hypothetical protein H8E87_00365 [FCB group bacterium]|nr:hypothetical protein [FCB group bacterium]
MFCPYRIPACAGMAAFPLVPTLQRGNAYLILIPTLKHGNEKAANS